MRTGAFISILTAHPKKNATDLGVNEFGVEIGESLNYSRAL
jgi:hypothetical protein